MLSACGGCEAAVNITAMLWLAKSTKCCVVLSGKRFNLKLKWTVLKSYVRPAILYWSEVC